MAVTSRQTGPYRVERMASKRSKPATPPPQPVKRHLPTTQDLYDLILRVETKLDARIDRLDAKIDARYDDLANGLAELNKKVDFGFDRLGKRLDRVEARLDRVEARLTSLEGRMTGLERQFEDAREEMRVGFRLVSRRFGQVDARHRALEARL